jgi:signal recognition particle receptor subunit beta
MISFKYTWPDYLPSSPHAAILVIDASSPETFSNTRKVLHDLCAHEVCSHWQLCSNFTSDRTQALSRCPVLVFANKCDRPNCLTVEKIYEGLNLAPLGQLGRKSAVVRPAHGSFQILRLPTHRISQFRCSATHRFG